MLEQFREKAIRLVDYISDLSHLRTTQQRKIESYENVLWLSDIPNENGFFTQMWKLDTDYDHDIWIEIKHPKEPQIPKVPSICLEFVKKSTLSDKENRPELAFPKIDTDASTNNDCQQNFLANDENPEEAINKHKITEVWDNYCKYEWQPWVDLHNDWQSKSEIYSKLFAIHQAILKSGEEFELIVGFGLLSWKTPQNQDVHRHVIVANAQLDFERTQGTFTVKPMIDGTKIRIELDMLELEQQQLIPIDELKEELLSVESNPWEDVVIQNVLKKISHSVHPNGQFSDTNHTNVKVFDENPIIEYAPALILRKRSSSGLVSVLGDIKKAIQDGVDIPIQFRDLAEITNAHSVVIEHSINSDITVVDEVYFPKPTNDEQYKIVKMLSQNDGLIVQGPPGTGKSHTIANLICHLLATGKRILVTAKTPRALLVLEKLIPDELKPLCINLLGDGLQERESLEKSVSGILSNTEAWNQVDADNRLESIKTTLNELMKEQASINNQIKAIRESETRSHSIASDSYSGTASSIAQIIENEKEIYGWFRDKINYDQDFSINPSLIIKAVHTLRRIPDERKEELQKSFPIGLPASEEFSNLCERESALYSKIDRLLGNADESVTNSLLEKDISLLDDFLQSAINYRKGLQKLEVISLPWMFNFVRDIIKNQTAILQDLHTNSKSILENLAFLSPDLDAHNVQYPKEIPLVTVLDNVSSLKNHIIAGGKLGWFLFRPKVVKESLFVLKRVTLNGESCMTVERLTSLERIIKGLHCFEQVWKYWNGICDEHPSPLSMQYAQLKDLVKKLEILLGLNIMSREIRNHIQLLDIASEPDLMSSEAMDRFSNSIDIGIAKLQLKEIQREITDMISPLNICLSTHTPHPIVSLLISSITQRNRHDYDILYQNLAKLIQDSQDHLQAHETLQDLSTTLQILSNELLLTYTEIVWDDRLVNIQKPWRWAQAKSWLEDYIGNADVPSMNQRLEQILKEISSNKSEQAAKLAWNVLYPRLSDSHRRHIVAWKQAITKVGKGHGKHAQHYRRIAQEYLDDCREAIPAWVMPLHRVWDTIKPMPGMFDVVIVDEASQCGFEGLPLFYLGKKIIIVGDDKQIRPEAIGIRQEAVFSSMNRYLSDFDYKDSFDITSSLYDHAKLRYSRSSVSLREHFRCMPEIIRFSNDLCYTDTPLIPLRQYGSERLAPLVHTYVSNGYREGSDSKVINRPEAEMIADVIKELCKDKRYDNKTMGVIVLQGLAQAGLIEQELLKRIDVSELEERRLICGNPYSFQGDERDIIFLSLVAANNQRIGPFTSPPDIRRFNVAASRAKDQMWLFHSVAIEDLHPNDLRRRLLEHFLTSHTNTIAGIDIQELRKRSLQDNRSVLAPPQPFDSWFEVDVALEIAGKGYEVVPQFEVAGKRIDLVVEGGQPRLAIECDGDKWHGIDQYDADMLRQRQLERSGWQFWRVRGSSFYANRIEAMSDLWKVLDDKGIFTLEKRQLIAMGINTDVNNRNHENLDEDEMDLDIVCDAFPSGYHCAIGSINVDDVNRLDVFTSIIRVLKGCPNNSCTSKSVPTRVLQDLRIITRGKPRKQFEKLVDDCLNTLIIKDQIWKYKTSKNLRIKLNPDNV